MKKTRGYVYRGGLRVLVIDSARSDYRSGRGRNNVPSEQGPARRAEGCFPAEKKESPATGRAKKNREG